MSNVFFPLYFQDVIKPGQLPVDGRTDGSSGQDKPDGIFKYKPDGLQDSDIKVEIKSSENRVITSSTKRIITTNVAPDDPHAARTPTTFPDPRSPTSKEFITDTPEARTPIDFLDPRSPTSKFSGFGNASFTSESQKTVTTKHTVIKDGKATTEVTQNKTFTTNKGDEIPPEVLAAKDSKEPMAVFSALKRMDSDDPTVNVKVCNIVPNYMYAIKSRSTTSAHLSGSHSSLHFAALRNLTLTFDLDPYL